MGENQGGSTECSALKTRRLRWKVGEGLQEAFDLVISERCSVWHVTGETAHVIRSEKAEKVVVLTGQFSSFIFLHF